MKSCSENMQFLFLGRPLGGCFGDSLTIKENEAVAEELRKTEDSNRRRQKYYK